MKKHIIIIFVLLVSLAVPVHAQDMTSNGTPHPHSITSSGLGTTINTEGSVFNITGGTQKGSNLFHSFGKFNIHSGESAVFHDSGIENTIGRVTGGEYSWINGILKSGAENLYLLNPAGVIFGANASLDLSGSFHVSTADYLRLDENEKFFAEPVEGEILSVAAPSAFGFLDKSEDLRGFENPVGLITFEGSGSAYAEENLGLNGIKVPEGETLSVIGGDIELKSGMITDDIRVESSLKAPGGRMNIASVASAGEVVPTETDLGTESFDKLGNITIFDSSYATVTSEGAGKVYIRGGDFVIDNSNPGEYSDFSNGVYATSLGDRDGGGIDIRLRGNLSITNGGEIMSNAFGSGASGDINIRAEETIRISGESNQGDISGIFALMTDAGAGGEISLEAKNLSLNNGVMIVSITYGSGAGGNITVRADEEVRLSGESDQGYGSGIVANALGKGEEAGDGGKIILEAKNLSLDSGAKITSSTYGSGDGGTIIIRTDEAIELSGESRQSYGSGIGAEAKGEGEDAGAGGEIILEAKDLSLADGAVISSATYGSGAGGNITIRAEETIEVSGEDTQGYISAIAADARGKDANAGAGGEIILETKNLSLANGAGITSSTFGSGAGGNITVRADETIGVSGESAQGLVSRIVAQTQGEDEKAGAGGEINLEAKNFSLANGTFISSSTYGSGASGNITVRAEDVRLSGESAQGLVSHIVAHAYGEGMEAGDGGEIVLEVRNLSLADGAVISSSTFGSGASGNITIRAEDVRLSGESSDVYYVTGIFTNAEGEGADKGTGGR